MSSDTDSPSEADTRTGISGVPMLIAVLALGVWVVFLVVMWQATDADETQWARLTYIFASVEAIAFAGAGALFGVTVQRERVQQAEKKAESNARDAAHGRALALATMADDGPPADPGAYAFDTGPAPDDIRTRHATLARSLFPDL